jgi:hypothetical protein
MNSEKYIRLDVSSGNDLSRGPGFQRQVSNRSILETQAATILEFLAGLRGTLWVTFEERNLGRLAIRLYVQKKADVFSGNRPTRGKVRPL